MTNKTKNVHQKPPEGTLEPSSINETLKDQETPLKIPGEVHLNILYSSLKPSLGTAGKRPETLNVTQELRIRHL